MTDDKALKRAVRHRMNRTGESYTTARRAVLAQPALRPAPTSPDDPLAIGYNGPPISPWTAAYMWAALITTLKAYNGDRQRGDFATYAATSDPGDSGHRAIIARAITIEARRRGLTGEDNGVVCGPEALNSVSVIALQTSAIFQPLAGLLLFDDIRVGYRPGLGEQGFGGFRDVYVQIKTDASDPWLRDEHIAAHQALVMTALAAAQPGDTMESNLFLRGFGARMGAYLRAGTGPDRFLPKPG